MIVVTAVSVACLPVFFSGHRIDRFEGAIFALYYVAYTTYLVLTATGHELLTPFRTALFFFVIPLTLLTILVVALRSYRRDDRAQESEQ